MKRRIYIQNQVLQIYRQMDVVSFPFDVDAVIRRHKNVRMLSYQEFAEATHCSIYDVIRICQSETGCTHYDQETDRYLVLYNDDGCVPGRILWTKAHELGHIVLKHFADVRCARYAAFAEEHPNGVLCADKTQIESEADTFASIVLCPFPMFKDLGIRTALDIESTFGVSRQAAEISETQYKEWRANHRKTSWENDMRSLLYTDAED